MATKDRLNYFLYNICHPSEITQKFEASIIFTQLEVGAFHQFFSLPFQCCAFRFGKKPQSLAFTYVLPSFDMDTLPSCPTG